MAAGQGFKTFTTGEVLTAADVNGYLMQGVLVFASEAARDAAITSPQEGQFAYTKDNNSLWYYTGSAWAASGATGDIEGVTAGIGISGGGTSGTVTITNDMATTITAAGDIVIGTGSGTYDNLPIGTTAQVLTADTTVSPYKVKWATPSAGFSNPMTTTGDIIYSSPGSTPVRLGIGTVGQVLQVNAGATAPEWTTPAGGGGMTLISTTSLSGSQVDLTSISGSYNNLVLVIRNYRPSTDQASILLRVNADSNSRYTATGLTWGTAGGSQSFTTTAFTPNVQTDNGGSQSTMMFTFVDYANTSTWKMMSGFGFNNHYTTPTNSYYFSINGAYNQTGAISQINILNDTGNFTSGTALLYGVK